MNELHNETDEEAETRVRQIRAARALGQAADLAHYVRDLVTSGRVERGETLPEWSAPMRITAADDLDAFYAELVDWVTYWSRLLEFTPTATSVVWSSYRGERGYRVQGFKAGTTAEGAAALVRLQTMWLLQRADQINRHPDAALYHDDLNRFIWAFRGKYPTAPRPPKLVSSRPCPVCSEAAVGAEWFSADVLDVVVKCQHCGHQMPASFAQLETWLA